VTNDRKTVVLTGAAGGIGSAAARRLSANGWNVLAVDRDADQLARLGQLDHVATFAADVTSETDNQQMIATAEERFGAVNALIINAAITGGGGFETLSFEKFRQVIEINLFGAVLGIRAALPALRRGVANVKGGGAIVVTSSTMGLGGESENWAYGASKAALIGVVHSLSREIGWEGLRINALCPGPTRGTGMTRIVEEGAPEHFDMLAQNVPLQRWADPDEMAAVMEFLISPAASYVNGHAMVADGGALNGTGLAPPATGRGRVMPDH
jgi:NAD(P)-dependent dehydrogenase (short-subunit alcohol dehydrogenase family)